MNNPLSTSAAQSSETGIKSILEWLALAHVREHHEDMEQMHRQLHLLREASLPTAQRVKLLDLMFSHTEKIVKASLPELREVTLPVSRKLRQRTRTILDLLATLTQDYFNTLADLFDPRGTNLTTPPQTILRRAMRCVVWQIRINQLIAAPPGVGLWQQLHSAYHTARRLGLTNIPGPKGGESIHQIYACALLSGIAQPASFCSDELEFIYQYLKRASDTLELLETPPLSGKAIFWIDLDKDVPAHALIRRLPSPESKPLYFSCDAIARVALEQITELKKGASASSLGLPVYADTRPGKSVIRRLCSLWGEPSKRKFPRRRQSYRVHLCVGLDSLWRLIKSDGNSNELSEWMVTNESPDGYALMHMSGQTYHLRVGDIVALQPFGERAEAIPLWHVCIARWALSENPEHIELGLQLLTSRAMAAQIAQPSDHRSGNISALLLPETPPLRRMQSIVVPTGALRYENHKIIVVLENENLEIREVRATHLDEQTSSIEVFTILPDETT